MYKSGNKRGVMTGFTCLMVKGCQKIIGPCLPPVCRYTPTCSQYMLEALQKYGFIKGGWMGIKRICRCHPWHPGGCDPVP